MDKVDLFDTWLKDIDEGNGFAMVSYDLAMSNLDGESLRCYIVLLKYASISKANGKITDDGLPWIHPSKNTLARMLGKSTRSVTDYLGKLEEFGIIQRVPRVNDTDMIVVKTVKQLKQHGKVDSKPFYARDCSTSRILRTQSAESCVPNQQNPADTAESCLSNQQNPADNIYKDDIYKEDMVASQHLPTATGNSEILGLVGKVIESTTEKAKEKSEKRKSRKYEPKENVPTLLGWFNEQLEDRLGMFKPMTTGADRGIAKQLIENYGYEMTKKMLEWCLNNWNAWKPTLKPGATLGMPLIMGWRQYIIQQVVENKPQVQVGRKSFEDDPESAW